MARKNRETKRYNTKKAKEQKIVRKGRNREIEKKTNGGIRNLKLLERIKREREIRYESKSEKE